jgi:hypothetical protein
VRVVHVNLRLAVALAALAMAGPAHAAQVPEKAPVSAHAMVHSCCTPAAEKEKIFEDADRLGAAYIRVDVELTGDWTGLDQVARLSRRHRLPVLGVLITAPDFTDAGEFGRLAGEAAARTAGTIGHWQVMNEPDGGGTFHGTPEQYARMLSAAHDAIETRAPDARVVFGGLQDPRPTPWLRRVLATPGADALHRFDIAAIHLRGPVERVVKRYGEFSAWIAERGFRGPVWVTELGYPADPAFQTDPAYRGGADSQAAYLTQALVGLGEAGAPQVFVTLRDNPELLPRAVSEGVVGRPAFAALRRVVDDWGQLVAWRADQREHERLASLDLAAARASAAGARAARARARTATGPGERARAFRAGAEVATLWHTAVARGERRRAFLHGVAAELLRREIAWKPGG